MSVALAVLIRTPRRLSKRSDEDQWGRAWWHTGSTSDLINGETNCGVMQLSDHGDYCLPVMCNIDLIRSLVETERKMCKHPHRGADRCVRSCFWQQRGNTSLSERITAIWDWPHTLPRRVTTCLPIPNKIMTSEDKQSLKNRYFSYTPPPPLPPSPEHSNK